MNVREHYMIDKNYIGTCTIKGANLKPYNYSQIVVQLSQKFFNSVDTHTFVRTKILYKDSVF